MCRQREFILFIENKIYENNLLHILVGCVLVCVCVCGEERKFVWLTDSLDPPNDLDFFEVNFLVVTEN